MILGGSTTRGLRPGGQRFLLGPGLWAGQRPHAEKMSVMALSLAEK